MRFSLAAATAALLATTQAHIDGIAVPSTIKPGEPFDLIILSSNFPQRTYDVGIAVGYAGGNGFQGQLGQVANSFYLGPNESNLVHNFNKTVTIPSSQAKGKGMIAASLHSLLGAAAYPSLQYYNVSVTFGSKTSKTYKSSF